MTTVNLDRIQSWIDQGRLNCKNLITLKELYRSGCIGRPVDGVKILGDGASAVKQPMEIIASRASASAIAAIEAAGGKITTRYYTPSSIRGILAGDMHTYLSYQWAMKEASKRNSSSDPSSNPSSNPSSDSFSDPSSDLPGYLPGDLMEDVPDWQRALNQKQKNYRLRLPDPTKRRDIEYYRDPAHRGYLSYLLKHLEGPSLFFRSSEERKSAAGTKKLKVLPENRLW